MAHAVMAVVDLPLDVRLARAARSWTFDGDAAREAVADRLVALAGGNRTAVARALGRVSDRGRAAGALRLALARGAWAW